MLFVLGIFLVFTFSGFPVVLSAALSTISYSLVYETLPPVVIVQLLVTGLDNPALSAIPYYFLLGSLLNASGLTRRLLRLARALLAWSRGGLSQVNIGASMLFGGMSGSAVADVSAVGSIMIPAMRHDGYSGPYAAAVTASSASIGLLIPPSLPLVMFGLFNNASVGQLFLAGIAPGILMGCYLMITSYVIARKRGYNAHRWQGWQEIKVAFKECFFALITPVFIIYSLVTGIATPTEIGALAVAYTVFVALVIYREASFRDFLKSWAQSAIDSAKVLSIVAVSGGMLWIAASLDVTAQVTEQFTDANLSPTQLLLLVSAFQIVIGTVIGPKMQIILFIPTITPVVLSAGIDILHFGVVSVLSAAIGLITPPVGFLIFLTAVQAETSVLAVVREILPFLAAIVLLLVTIIFFPQLTTAIPGYFN